MHRSFLVRLLILAVLLGAVLSYWIVRAQAAINASVLLSGNSIATAPVEPAPRPEAAPHFSADPESARSKPMAGETAVALQRLKLDCTAESTPEVSRVVSLRIYNFGRSMADIGGWQFAAGNGTLYVVPEGEQLPAHISFTAELELADGLRHEGGYVELLNDEGEVVDAISWGDNASRLDPPLPPSAGETEFHRHLPINGRTERAEQWDVRSRECDEQNL